MFMTAIMLSMASAPPVTVSVPVFDRWVYPFNATPGTRAAAPTFGAIDEPAFDDRDGQALFGWETNGIVSSGWSPSAYDIVSCTVTVPIGSDDIILDTTPDDPATHDPDGPADADAGRPTLLSGVGFRGGYDGWSFGEDGPFGPIARDARYAYAADFGADGELRDISNSLTAGFVPNHFAIGTTDLVQPGELIPQFSDLTFELTVSDPDVQCYLKTGLADGLLEFMVTSLHLGAQDASTIYPDWIMKENALVDLGLVSAATLTMEVTVIEPSGVLGDVDGDGGVGIEDLLMLLADFGRCPCCITDIDGNGFVEVDDLLSLISNWGQ